MPPIKKQDSPAPTPRAAALSQSASRHSAAATSTWQSIAAKSARLAPGAARGPVAAPLAPPAAPRPSRLAEAPQHAVPLVAPAEKRETVRQVGWHEVDRAVSVRTERKYNLFGFKFGPKVPVVETEKMKLPVYQETDRAKRYYAVVKAEELDQVKREGLQPATISSHRKAAPLTVEQFNTKGYLQFFTSEAAAYRYARAADAADYVVVPFLMPEYQDFTPDLAKAAPGKEADASHAMRTPHAVPPEFVKPAR